MGSEDDAHTAPLTQMRLHGEGEKSTGQGGHNTPAATPVRAEGIKRRGNGHERGWKTLMGLDGTRRRS